MNALIRISRWVIGAELLWLSLLAPLLLFPEGKRGWAIVALPLLWLGRWLAWRRLVPRTPLDWPIALLLAMTGVGLAVSFDPLFSFPKVTGILLGIAFYYAMVEQASRRHGVALGVMLLVAVSSVVAGVGLFATNWPQKLPFLADYIAYLPGFLLALPGSPPEGFNPNGVAGALLFVLPLLFLLAWPLRNPLYRGSRPLARLGVPLLLLPLLLLILGTLLLTQSRGAYLGLLAAFAFLLWFTHPRLFLAGATASLLAVGVAFQRGLLPPYVALGPTYWYGAFLWKSGRPQIWARAILAIQDFAFTGTGIGLFRRVVPLVYPLARSETELDIGHAHNHFLAVGTDLGVPGLVAYTAIWLGIAAMSWQSWHRASPLRWVTFGLAAGLFAHFIWGTTDAGALGTKPSLLLWLTLGALALVHRRTVEAEQG